MYDFRARCQTTFWQLKTLQLCLDLDSCSSGLDSGAFVLNSKARCQVWGVWRAWLSWRWALSYLLHTTDLDFKWTWVREEQEKVIWQYLIAGWAYCLHSALIWGWRAPWKTGRARKLENDKKTKLYSSKTGEGAAAHMTEAAGCPTPTAISPSLDRPTSSLRRWPCHRLRSMNVGGDFVVESDEWSESEKYCCRSVAVSNTFAKTQKTTCITLSYPTGVDPFSVTKLNQNPHAMYMKIIKTI